MPTQRTETRAELVRAVGVLAEPPGPEQDRLAGLLGLPPPDGIQWAEAFIVQLVPYASIYLSPDGMLGGEAGDRVAGFWRALRQPSPTEPDHLTALLGLYAKVIDATEVERSGHRRALWLQARTALLHEHMASWLLPYANAMAQAGPPAYAAWAAVLEQTIYAEAAELGAPDRLPIHLREVPPLDGVDAGLDALLVGILAPARSGLIVTRAHLGEIARRAGLGLRRATRQHMLRALIEQDPPRTLHALADVADQWSVWHRTTKPAAGVIATYLADRAEATARVLRAGAENSQQEATR